MSDSLNLSTAPLFIAAGTEYEAEIQNGGPGTVYYGSTNAVSSTNYTGTIASGKKLHITSPVWIVATTNTKVFIERYTYTQDVDYDVRVIGEVMQGLDTTYTIDEATRIQTAINNVESQGGGRVLFPATQPDDGYAIKIGSLITVPEYVSVQGHGKWETEFKCSAAAAGFLFQGVGDTPSGSRGGSATGFHINGNQLSSIVLETHAVNRNFYDLRISNPKAAGGVAIRCYGAQNNNFIGCEAEDQYHTSNSSVRGVVFDGGTAGMTFWGTSLNEFTDGHVVFDATGVPTGMTIPHATNINWYGNLIERTDTGNPIIQVLAGADIHFHGGNISTGGGFTPAAEYDVIDINNDAALSADNAGSSPTQSVSFADITFWCAMGAASTRYANVFRVAANVASWRKTLDIAPSCGYTNAKYLARIDSTQAVVRAPNPFDGAGGGLSAGWSNPAGTGKINTRTSSSAGTFPTRSTVDYYEVTGTTNIDSCAVSYEGHQVTLKFGGSLTVSSSAGNIKLSGLSDMSATADDILCLICDGTNWHETSRVVK